MASILISPFVHDSKDVAYAAYCAMPHAKRKDFKKPTKAQFTKMYNERHAAAKQEYLTKLGENNAAAAQEAVADPTAHIDPQVLEALRALGLNIPEPEVEEEEEQVDPQVQALIDRGVSPDIAEQLVGMLSGGTTTSATTTTRKKQYRARTANDQVPANAARNQLLWALNSEGLLEEALAECKKQGLDYITREVGQALMTREFGPLPANNSRA